MDGSTQHTTTGIAMATALPEPMRAQAGPAGGDLGFMMVIAVMFLIFYVLVFRPNSKAQKEKEAAIAAATKGDEVVTVGGIHGKVVAVEGEVFEIEVARLRGEKVKLRVDRQKIDRVEKAGAGGAADDEKGGKGKGGES